MLMRVADVPRGAVDQGRPGGRMRAGRGALLLCLLVAAGARAHDVDQGYVYLSLLDTSLAIRIELNVRDVNRALALDLPEDGSMKLNGVVASATVLESYLRENLALRPDGRESPMVFSGFSIRDTEYGQFLMADFRIDELPVAPESVDVVYALVFDAYPDHRGFVLIENDWRTQVFENEARYSLIFSPDERSQTLDLSGASVLSGFLGMVELGAHHIWIGIDHVLFLLALLLPSVMRREGRRWLPTDALRPALIQIVKVVTLFTLGHTLTLCLAALGIVELNPRLVESVIAVSIAIAAADMIYPIFGNRLIWVAAVFGLFHGFGFANVLAEMPVPEAYVLPSLFGFNIGVELGQLVIVLIVVPILFLLRGLRAYASLVLPAAASMLIVVSLYWFTERAFLIDLPAGAIVQQILGMQ